MTNFTSKVVNEHLVGLSYRDIVDHLTFDEDHGGCCGHASCEEVNHIPKHVDKDRLVLKSCISLEYETGYGESRSVLNFIFSDGDGGELILGYELTAGSGSGWSYGAYVKISHKGVVLAEERW